MSKKILVIDDDDDIITYLTTLLEDHGYVTLSATDGRQGLELAKREMPDLITLDLLMPNQTGTDFYRKLVKDKDLADIPIIVVSGTAGRHLAVKKPAAVFQKPIDRDAFLEAVENALKQEND